MVETSTEKKLRLSQENKMLAGVCGGLAEYFDVDVSVIRFIFIILTFVYGIGIITYIILLVFLPEK
ncbi:MAG: PspC domain-containing protein [Candidatus Cloacimonetes bacterium]|nr:PspC domain-containing protein [Candidatus Cloacimonadota bacterium]MBS3766617.1 PspC domain-containing protein [Candidatus Cloacimonadota bacterium]